MKVLMVCLGNICRSPLAEGILRHKATKRGLDLVVDSCGTGSWHIGQAPDKRSQLVARVNGIDISGLRGRQVSEQDFLDFDVIMAMDRANQKDLLTLAKTEAERQKVRLMLDYLPNRGISDVPDPYYGTAEDFAEVFILLDLAIDKFITTLK